MEKGKENWGSAFLRTRISKEPYNLNKRGWKDLNVWEWTYFVISLIYAVVSIGFCIYHVVLGSYIFPSLLVVTNVFGVFFLFNGVLQELPFQVLMHTLTKILVWTFDLIYLLAFTEPKLDEESAEYQVKRIRFYISSGLVTVNLILGAYLTWKYWVSNATIFKTVGTEPKYVELCKVQFRGYSLIGFDAELAVLGVLIIATKIIFYDSSAGDKLPLDAIILLPFGLVYVGVWTAIGYIAISRESRRLTYAFFVASHAQPVYIIFLFVAIANIEKKGSLLYITTFVLGGIYFLFHAWLMFTVVKIYLNYGKGLKQAAAKETAKARYLGGSLSEDEFMQTPETRLPAFETEM